LTRDKKAVNESYAEEYWIQVKTKRGRRDGYTREGRINVKLFKCCEYNDWALLRRVSGVFNDDEIVELDRTALDLTEAAYLDIIHNAEGAVVHCPVSHIQNTTYANEFTLIACKSCVTVFSASFRHIHFSGNDMVKGSSGGAVIVNGKLVGMNQDRIHNDIDEEAEYIPDEFCDEAGNPLPVQKVTSTVRTTSEEKSLGGIIINGAAPASKKLKSDSETVASRSNFSGSSLNSAIIICRCSKLMTYYQLLEDDE
jgi:hypothetical protein